MRSQINTPTENRTFRDLLEIIFRHKKKAMLFFFIVVITAAVTLSLTPQNYTSTSKLIIRRGRENVFLDPTAATGNMLPIYKEWESEVNTELEILNSHELVQEVIEELGPDVFVPTANGNGHSTKSFVRKYLVPVRQWLVNARAKMQGMNKIHSDVPQSNMDKAVQFVEHNLQINVRNKSDIITVSYTATTPDLAQDVVSRLVALYLEKRIGVHRTPGAHEFFIQQTSQLLTALRHTENSINEIKQSAGIFSLEDNRSALLAAIESVRAQQGRVEASLVAANAKVDKLSAMLQQNTGDTPGAALDRGEYRDLQTALRMEETEQSALNAELRELSDQLAGLRSELAELNTLETPLRTLEREQELLENKYRRYSENEEQARINEALETKKISNVTIVQRATLPERANPAGKAAKAMAAVFLALVGGLGIPFLFNALDPSMHSESDVTERMDIPTLIELPNTPSKALLPDVHPPKHKRGGSRYMRGGKLIHRNRGDYFEDLRFKVLSATKDKTPPLVIGVTAGSAGEGVTCVAANLAAAMAREGHFNEIILFDANPDPHSRTFIKNMPNAPFSYKSITSFLVKPDKISRKNITAGVFSDILTNIKKQGGDIIIVDIPPISEGGYAAQIASEMDTTILVIEASRTSWRTAQWTLDLLKSASADVCGIVLNRQRFSMPNWLYRKL
ncbi:MAG: hypothetical protein EOL87_14060 [Spartobacteria bacterium]|nr:hypothetical protein [Spartobacteria bacterium]